MENKNKEKVDVSLDAEAFYKKYGRKKIVSIFTLGCRVNHYETEAIAELFKNEGYDIVDFNEPSDVYVINTCTVTNMSDRKSRQMIRKTKRVNPDSIVAVVGCYSQVEPTKVASIEGVDIVAGTRNKSEILNMVESYREKKIKLVDVEPVLKNKLFEDLNINEYQDKTRAFLKIQDGCNRFCTYCIIPFARGAVTSKEPDKIIEEVKRLAENGYKEVVLSGIHIASYGVDLNEDISLLDILEKIDLIDGIERIRIGSIEPRFADESNVKRLKNLKKLCPHFHLSLQSGCDETLERMNRKYTAAEYKESVNRLRENISDVSITTDVIVGFPGETEEEFQETVKFLKEINLTKLHVFKYSKREGTKAAEFENQIPEDVKDERSKILINLSDKSEKAFTEKYIGRTMPVLFEQRVNNKPEYIEGYTNNYIKTIVKADEEIEGAIKNVIINETQNETAIGILE